MGKPTIYLESSIISYLAAHPSRDLIVAGHQQITHEWWDGLRDTYDLYLSEAVLDEISLGDPGAAVRRLQFASGIPLLRLTNDMYTLAVAYRTDFGLPAKATVDCLHLGCSVVSRMDYLLTWNCAHIANGKISENSANLTVNRAGIHPP